MSGEEGETLVWVLRAVEQFEDGWKRGEPATLEEVLGRADDTKRSELFRWALGIEIDYRRGRGEAPDPEEYLGRFPEEETLVHEVFGETTELPRSDRSRNGPASTLDAKAVGRGGAGGSQPTTDASLSETPLWAGTPPGGWAVGAPRKAPTIPGFVIHGELGRGGMGVVYRATRLGLNREVALKMILAGEHAGHDQVRRFLVEAEAVARLRHPNVVQVYDMGEVDGQPYVALELLDGGSLSKRLEATTLSARAAAGLIATLARAVEAAHRAGVIHRDIKPSNVLFDSEGVPKVADFGLAKRIEAADGHTESGQVMGSPRYMAPEQARGHAHKVGPQADVYALGAVLYELLTGRPPFKAPTAMETMFQVINDPPVPPSRLQRKVPRDLETVCLKCLDKDPERRYATAEELAVDLESFLSNRPVRARRTPAWERLAKWARRRPAEAALVGSGLLGAACLVAGVLWYQDVRYRQKLDDSRRVDRLRAEANGELIRGQDAVARGDWSDGQKSLTRVIERVRPEPRLADLRDQAERLLSRAEQAVSDRKDEDAARTTFSRFLALRNEALFREVRFAGLGLADDPESARRPAREALKLYPKGSAGLPSALSAREREAVDDGRDTLRLVLAGAAADPKEGLKELDAIAADRPSTRALHLRRAACLAALGDAAGARREADEAERIEPASASDHFLSGRERFRDRRWDEARRHFDAALLRQPDHFWAECLLAVSYLQLNRPVEARACLDACLRAEPDAAWLLLLRAVASGKVAVVTQSFAGRDPVLGRRAGEAFQDAEQDYARALDRLDKSPNPPIDLRYTALVNRGVLRAQRGDLSNAAADLSAALALAPELHQAYAELGLVLGRQGKPAEAAERLGQAIAKRPDRAELYRARAGLFLDDPTPAESDAALADLDEALHRESADNPVRALDHANRGWLLARAGRQEDALAAYEAALRVRPDYAVAQRRRIGVLLRIGKEAEAARACDLLLAQGNRSAWLHEFRGLIRERKGDHAGAVADLSEALTLEPDRPDVLAQRGWSYLLSGASRLALADFERAIVLAPDAAEAYAGRGAARAALGQPREAVADAERSLRPDAADPRRLFLAARTYTMAMPALTAGARPVGRETVLLANRYADRAVALLNEAIRRKPAASRAAFVRDTVLNDPVLCRWRRRLDVDPAAGPAPSPRPASAIDVAPSHSASR